MAATNGSRMSFSSAMASDEQRERRQPEPQLLLDPHVRSRAPCRTFVLHGGIGRQLEHPSGFITGHVQKPSLEIGDQRKNGQSPRNPHQNQARRLQAQAEAVVGQHGCRKHELGGRIDLAHGQRLDAHRLIHQPRQQHRQQDQNVAADDRDHQPQRNLLAHAKRDVDADDQQLVGQRIEIGAELGASS